MSFKLNTKLQARKKAVLTGRLKRRAEKCILEDKDEDSGEIDGSDNETVTSNLLFLVNVHLKSIILDIFEKFQVS